MLEIQRKIKTANNSIKDLNMDRQRLTKRIHEIEDRFVSFFSIEFSNIENVNLIKSTGAFYLFPDVSYYSSNGVINGVHNSIDFCNWLLDEYFIAFVPGEVFGKNGFLRCSYALSDDDLHEGLSRFSKAIKEIQ